MIKYTLRCSHGHHFEDWFASSSKYDQQAQAGELSCPECGDTTISKAIMAPSVATSTATPAPSCGASACGNMGCPAMRG